MINGVEFVELHQFQQVREFEREDSFGLKQKLQAFDEIVQIWHLSEDVVAEDEIGAAA